MPNVYFGNLRKAVSIPAPKSGMEATASGRIETLELANGGAFVSQSQATHREYGMSWGVTEESLLSPLYQFRRGVYGSGLLYYCDPYVSNALPAHWAEPALTGGDWPSLLKSGLAPTIAPSGTDRINYAVDPRATTYRTQTPGAYWSDRWPADQQYSTVLGALDGPPGIMSYARSTAKTAHSTTRGFHVALNPDNASPAGLTAQMLPVTVGETITVSAYWRTISSVLTSVGVRFTYRFATAGGAWVAATVTGPTTNINNGNWGRPTATFTVPATAAFLAINIIEVTLTGAATHAIGDTLDSTGLLIERSGTLGTYFDGSSRFVNGSVVSWASAENNSTSTMTTPIAGMPASSAVYQLSAPLGDDLPSRAAVLLVPPTKTLWVGFSGSASNGGGVHYRTVGVDGSISGPRALTLLSPSGSTRLNTSFDGASVSAVMIFLDTATLGSASVTLNSGTAVYATTGSPPTLTGLHTPGEGHTGLRFKEEITKTLVIQRNNKNYITAAASLTEIGAWL